MLFIYEKPKWCDNSHRETVKENSKTVPTGRACPYMEQASLVWIKFERIDLFKANNPKKNAQLPDPYRDHWVPIPLMKE